MSEFPEFNIQNIAQFPQTLSQYLKDNLQAIDALLSEKKTWSWDNLIQPLEAMEEALERLWAPISHLHAVMNSPALRESYQACLPILSQYHTHIGHHKILFEAVRSLDMTTLSATQKKVVEDILLQFKLSGIALEPSAQKRFEVIQERLSTLSNQFETNVLDCEDQYEYWVQDEKQLRGLPQHTIKTAQDTAREKQKDGWCLTLAYPCYLAVLTYAEDNALRKTLYEAYQTRASEIGPHKITLDNTAIIDEIIALRTEEAQLLGFKHFSEYSLATKMAKSTEEVVDFLHDLSKRALLQARQEFKSLQDFAKTSCQIDHIELWDMAYVSQKMKQSLFSLTDEALRPYFPLHHVLDEIQKLLKTLFGVSFKKRPPDTCHTWHPDVECYEIEDENHNIRGYLYLDLFARPNKRNGAWMDSLQSRYKYPNGNTQLPIATLTCNFAKPIANQKPTLTHDEVITLLHELGHCLHHTLTTVDIHSVTGIHGVEWDAVELPSQFLENWGWEKQILQTLSSHVETHQPISDDLLTQLIQSKNYLSALGLVRQIELALFDFELHKTTQLHAPDWVKESLKHVRQLTRVIPISPYDRIQNSFTHIFSGGYAAGYYSYLWAEVLSSDAFARFQENGLVNAKIGRDFLHCILEVGGSRKAYESYLCFRGHTPTTDALLKSYGILNGASDT